MPKYRVQAHDGKTLTIEAPDEGALDEAMRDYESQGAKAEAPVAASAPVEEPDFYNPAEIAKRGAIGAAQTLPFAGAVMNKAQGKEAYQGSGLEKGSAMLGDVSNAALTALTLGKGLGAGAALNAGLEASGVNEGLRKAGLALENAYEPKSSSVALNMLGNAPAYAGSMAMNILPAILAGKFKFGEPAPVPGIDPAIEARANFAKAEGLPLTKGETLGRTSQDALKEAAYRRSPGGEGAALDMQAKQQAAIREGLAKRVTGLGDDVLAGEIRQGAGMTEGRQLADVPDAAKQIRSERGQAVGDAKAALAQEIPIRSNFAKELSGTIDEALKKVSNAGKGSNRAKVADLLESYKEQAKTVKTMAGAINFLDDFDSAIKGTFDREAPNVQKVHLADVRNKILDVLDEAGQHIAPEAQSNLKTAKAGFREIADPAQDLRSLEETNPSALLRGISGGNKSVAKVQGFNKVFEPGSPQRQGLKSALIQDVIKKGTMKEGVSGSAMAKALDKIDQSTLNEIFSDNPKELADFKGFLKGLSDIEAQRTPLGIQPNNNSHTAPLTMVGKLIGLKVPGVGWATQKLADYQSGKAFKPYQLEAPKPSGLRQALSRRPEAKPLDLASLGRQLAANAQAR